MIDPTVTRGSLTPRQNEYYEYIRERVQSGTPPTIPEICEHFSLKSTNGVHQVLSVLERKGYIRRDRGKSRGIVLPRAVRSADAPGRIPIVGRGDATNPYSIFMSPRGMFTPDPALFSTDNAFAAIVADDAMDAEGIFKGDYVIVRQDPSPAIGTVVFALHGRDQIVRRIRSVDETPVLTASNRHYQDIELSDGVAVMGTVIGVVRAFAGE